MYGTQDAVKLEEGEKDLLKIGLETMVRSQGFSEVDFRFIRLAMMTTKSYVLKKGLETYVSEESRGRCYLVDECLNGQH